MGSEAERYQKVQVYSQYKHPWQRISFFLCIKCWICEETWKFRPELRHILNPVYDLHSTHHTGWFRTHRLEALRSLTRRSVWAQTSPVRTSWWPSLTASSACPTQASQLEERLRSWTTWFLKTCWTPTSLLSTSPGTNWHKCRKTYSVTYHNSWQLLN